MRGEDWHKGIARPRRRGSSPRARGGRNDPVAWRIRGGLIPACAGRTRLRWRTSAASGAHPRVRGEDHVGQLVHDGEYGSSPRARGGPRTRRASSRAARLIPACAGRTGCGPRSCTRQAAHPRVRGEDATLLDAAMLLAGSSPRARGGRPAGTHSTTAVGLIPACAGRTIWTPSTSRSMTAHPRVRGEDRCPAHGFAFLPGSSPRARGGPTIVGNPLRADGLIPACAGRTPNLAHRNRLATAHPRVRGEDQTRCSSAGSRSGSSPRARGGRSRQPPDRSGSGLIPACAGRTPSPRTNSPWATAHPRVRGEDGAAPRRRPSAFGSSPRARGGHRDPLRRDRGCGLIPACAGRTPCPDRRADAESAHPRVRGEDAPRLLIRPLKDGSSPRARGGRGIGEELARHDGLIPACAGRTRTGSDRRHP